MSGMRLGYNFFRSSWQRSKSSAANSTPVAGCVSGENVKGSGDLRPPPTTAKFRSWSRSFSEVVGQDAVSKPGLC